MQVGGLLTLMKKLLTSLGQDSRVKLRYRAQLPAKPLGQQGAMVEIDGKIVEIPARKESGPAEIEVFRNEISEMVVFPPRGSGMQHHNGWWVPSTDAWLGDTVNEYLVGDISFGGLE